MNSRRKSIVLEKKMFKGTLNSRKDSSKDFLPKTETDISLIRGRAYKFEDVYSLKDIFYTTNELTDKRLFKRTTKGIAFKTVRLEGEVKIVARINNAIYNFPAIVALPGTKDKIAAAYAELNRREKMHHSSDVNF